MPDLRPTRRSLLKGTAATTAALLAPKAAFTQEQSDVIVVGAGLSGLYSALLLEEEGYKVTVLEASDQVGGRVQTREIAGRPQELGASDIGIMYARVIDMVERLGLERIPTDINVRPPSYHVRGQMVRAEEWESSSINLTAGDERAVLPPMLENTYLFKANTFTELDDWLHPQNAALDIPFSDFLKNHGASDEALRLINVSSNCMDLSRFSALAALRDFTRLRYSGFEDPSKDQYDPMILSKVKGGNQRLPEAMAAALSTEVKLNSPVQTIAQNVAGVEVTVRNGTRYKADFIIVTASLHALKQVSFEPGLPPAQAAAIAQMAYYPVTKLYLHPTAPYWEADGFEPTMWTDTALERTFALVEEDGSIESILMWINGAGVETIDRMPLEDAKHYVLDTMAKIRPASKGNLEVIYHYAWGQEPFIGGCGSLYGPGQVTQLAEEIPKPVDRLYFAGEHTRRLEFGMESAMASAERVYGEILEAS